MGTKKQRIDELLRTLIAEEVAELKDPRLGFVTITAVKVTPDLYRADVYFSVLGDEERRAATQAGLASASARVRARVAARVRLRRMPELHFRPDLTLESALRISEILTHLEDDQD